jgi:DNA (cytosine-5)-methyltransferase 1
MSAYYNEIDPDAAQWLRNLIAAGHIAPGDVDERSIKDIAPDDLSGYTQCHFFAGIGVWSYALRNAGWPDDRPVWTGSCPCQPFSTAGKGEGLDDPRHLWPDWLSLIRERRPVVVLGEQVSGKDGRAWLDLTRADLEDDSYATGALVACSAGVGGPDIRQRLYWMAHAVRDGAGHAPGQGVGAQAAPDRGDGRISRQRLRTGVEGAADGLGDSRRQANGSGKGSSYTRTVNDSTGAHVLARHRP